MTAELAEEYRQLQELVAKFVKRELAPCRFADWAGGNSYWLADYSGRAAIEPVGSAPAFRSGRLHAVRLKRWVGTWRDSSAPAFVLPETDTDLPPVAFHGSGSASISP
jgi:hypothetical protein